MSVLLEPSVADKPSFDPGAIQRPDAKLLQYYLVVSLLTGPLFPLVFLPNWFKYHTLRYVFDENGVSMSWGFLFRREVHLTYRRIQDIHLTRNLIQRWMRLATVSIQTASGSALPEMSIEGVLEADRLRDYLYSQMRGARDGRSRPAAAANDRRDDAPHLAEAPQGVRAGSGAAGAPDAAGGEEVLLLLREIRDSLRSLAAREEQQS